MIACASAVARTAPLLSTRGASIPQCLRAHIPFPFADAGSSCEALSNVAHIRFANPRRTECPPRVSAQISERTRRDAYFTPSKCARRCTRPSAREAAEVQAWAPCVDTIASTASRLNEAGFWRGGNLTKFSICAATAACMR